MVDYLYRGAGMETMADELRDGQIPGYTATVASGRVRNPDREMHTRGRRSNINELDWLDGPDWSPVSITGGFTDDLTATERFRGTYGLVAVYDRHDLPFEKCEYTYEWFDNHPGAMEWMLTTADAELRLDDRGLWGILDKQPGGRGYFTDHWGAESLPGTSQTSSFADEEEWFAPQDSVDVSGALTGVVSLFENGDAGLRARFGSDRDDWRPSDREALPWIYDAITAGLPRGTDPYVLVLADGASPQDGAYGADDIALAYGDGGHLDPEDVPPRFRGVTA